MKKLLGSIFLLVGVLLFGWVGFNLFIEMQPEAQNQSPIPAVLFGAGLVYVGQTWLRE